MYQLLKPLLFQIAPEKAHFLTVSGLAATLSLPGVSKLLCKQYFFADERLELELFGLPFPNPVGLAAGFDKDGKYYMDMASLGLRFFGAGHGAPLPQDGNPQPRLLTLLKAGAENFHPMSPA